MRPAWMQSASVRSWSRPNRDLTSAKMRSDAAEDGTNVKTLFAAIGADRGRGQGRSGRRRTEGGCGRRVRPTGTFHYSLRLSAWRGG
eukprot:1062468-Prymnesium_polylepis.1